MPLTLVIRNATQLDNGSPLSLVLERRGAIIGRAATSDWCLPDPTLHISSRHCEVRFAADRYELIDHSTNGTFLCGQSARLAGPHPINEGDVFMIGGFEITATLDEAAAAAAASRSAAPPAREWKGWTEAASTDSAPPTSSSGWGAPPPQSAISGGGPMSQSWAAPSAAPAAPAASGWGSPAVSTDTPATSAASAWGPAASSEPAPAPPGASVWNSGPAPASTPASSWSAPVGAPPPPSPDDVWGKFAASNVVDWARGGFGTPSPAPVLTPAPVPPPAAPSPITGQSPPAPSFGSAPAAAPPPAPATTATPAAQPAAAAGAGLGSLLKTAQIDGTRLKQGEAETLERAGALMRRLVAGLVVMLEARARAKSQMGAQNTSLEFDGNNPLKFARSPEQALLQLLNPQERGFMDSDRAIEDAFKDLQAHQMATLRAMQGALKATLDRFSPSAIRKRAEQGGLLSKIMPGAREAALWKAYEKEFSGVAHGSDEAFMDMFAKEFRNAYNEIAKK